MLWPSTIEELRRGLETQQQLAPCATAVVCTRHELSTSRGVVANVCHNIRTTADWKFFWRERQTPASAHSLADLLAQDNAGVDQPGPKLPGAAACQPWLLRDFIGGGGIHE